ncbi:MAG: outer membrane beta-barrel protein [Blastocatellia bacterium]
MRKLFFIAALLLALPLITQAQDAPRVEIFGGYSYLRADDDNGGIDLHGWNASTAVNINKWVGIAADFSGHYGEASVFSLTNKADVSGYLFLVGPRFSYRKHKVLTPFGHVLLGAARQNVSVRTASGRLKSDDAAFALAIGGGLDATVHPNLAIRLFQTDYVLTRFNDDSQHNFRISTGLVLRLGTQ